MNQKHKYALSAEELLDLFLKKFPIEVSNCPVIIEDSGRRKYQIDENTSAIIPKNTFVIDDVDYDKGRMLVYIRPISPRDSFGFFPGDDHATHGKQRPQAIANARTVFRKAMKSDPEFLETYTANIAMAFYEQFEKYSSNHGTRNIGSHHVAQIANEAATRFLNLWLDLEED